MSKPFIEYHYAWFSWGRWAQDYKSYPVGTTFAHIKTELGVTHQPFTPLRLRWPSYAWPGGYETHYYTKDCGILCHQCANKEMDRTLDQDDDQFCIVAGDVHWEGPPMQCDHCYREIESCYGDPEEQS